MNTYTEEQLKFINYDGPNALIFSAVAGSGKTHSAVGRLRRLIDLGVDPKRMIFFSFTNDAVDELRNRIGPEDVRVTTIHSYTSSQLGKMGKYKPVATFYDFVNWYKEKYKPKPYESAKKRLKFQETIDKFYEEGAYISSSFSAYKLQDSDGVRCVKPKYYDEYREFLREENKRDFSDLLIECERLCQHPQFKHYFEGTYDHVFIDEYQDTSTLQLKVLLSIKAPNYHLIGDRFQSIYAFSGANCDAIEALLKKHHQVEMMYLTQNFRSAPNLVQHANNFTDLHAVPFKEKRGILNLPLIHFYELHKMMNDPDPITILVRTNAVIKEMEKEFLKLGVPMRYFNYITPTDLENLKKGNTSPSLRKRLDAVASYHGASAQFPQKLISFIEANQGSDKFITSIHKSKGREYPRVVVVNSFDPEQLEDKPHLIEDYSFVNDKGEFDLEGKNLHYVACTRPKDKLYFMLYQL